MSATFVSMITPRKECQEHAVETWGFLVEACQPMGRFETFVGNTKEYLKLYHDGGHSTEALLQFVSVYDNMSV